MGDRIHSYHLQVVWTGNLGADTATHAAYARDHIIQGDGKPPIDGSSDPAFRGDPARWNPEELLLASISACHKLWYLGLCAKAGIRVVAYRDAAEGTMTEDADGGGRFTQAVLRPRITLRADSDQARAERLHQDAHRLCFIANSVNFPIRVEPVFEIPADP
ncbi:MAG TPA: OsmC family protein [Rhodopila sp.]|nr:OsmC family protein [Rhodopila sp.]